MTTITQQLADALRAALPFVEAAERKSDDVPAIFCREALAAYDAQQAQPAAPAGEHTEEPWRVAEEGRYVRVYAGAFLLAEYSADNVYAVANARRIVACVNACAGMPTDEIESYGLGELAECARNWTQE